MKPTRYIAKCKACGTYRSALVTPDDYRAAQMRPTMGPRDPAPVTDKPYFDRMGNYVLDCFSCGRPKYAKPVVGRLNRAVACTAKCETSHGHVCECSCGGRNHGAAYAGA